MLLNSPCLWIVATPIGNFGDLSPRAIKVLSEADLILAEDTRRAGLLCHKIGINSPNFLSFFEHNEEERQQEILEMLKTGAKIALITDAGTPLLADPGYRLVKACRQQGIRVSPIPGPSAPITALCASGLPPLPFTFLGFLPRSAASKKNLFLQFANVPGSLVFFERKNRLSESLKMAYSCLGNREVAICRELTKTYEEFVTGHLENYATLLPNPIGEITVVIAPSDKNEKTPKEQVILLMDAAIDDGLKPRVAAKLINEKCTGWTTDEIYKMLIEIKHLSED